MKRTLYVQLQGASVRQRQQTIVVEHQGTVVEQVPRHTVDRVVVMGRGVQLSTALLVTLLQEGIPVVMTDQAGSRHYATLQNGPSSAADLRLLQYQRSTSSAWQLLTARAVLDRKLQRQLAVLQSLGRPLPAAVAAQLVAARTALSAAPDLDAVRGHEGHAAAAYFGAWSQFLPPQFQFTGRAYRPPRDPTNALLSFGYTLLLGTVQAVLHQSGLDPFLGCLHRTQDGRPSLALDLIEPFRPLIVDQCVLQLVAAGRVAASDFSPSDRPDGSLYLNAAGRALLIAAYEQQLQSVQRLISGERVKTRRLLLLDAQAYARAVRSGEVPTFSALRGEQP